MKTKIKFIGVGSAFAKNNYNSSFIIENNDKKLLIDCGRTTPEALIAAKIKWHEIDGVYISHEHSDHCGGLEEFAFFRYFVPPVSKPKLFISSELDNLWENTLKGGLRILRGKEGSLVNKELDDYFEVIINDKFEWENIMFKTFKVKHIMPSYGLEFEINDKKVLFSSDCTFESVTDNIEKYEDSDLIFQDCEVSPSKSAVHAHFDELDTLPDGVKKNMWLYHYQDLDISDLKKKAKKSGFAGFVEQEQIFE